VCGVVLANCPAHRCSRPGGGDQQRGGSGKDWQREQAEELIGPHEKRMNHISGLPDFVWVDSSAEPNSALP
jgi:hypothetical protein